MIKESTSEVTSQRAAGWWKAAGMDRGISPLSFRAEPDTPCQPYLEVSPDGRRPLYRYTLSDVAKGLPVGSNQSGTAEGFSGLCL